MGLSEINVIIVGFSDVYGTVSCSWDVLDGVDTVAAAKNEIVVSATVDIIVELSDVIDTGS